MKEKQHFESIRSKFCGLYQEVTEGKMMSSPAIHYKEKVFAFFSRKNKMVFKLGKDFNSDELKIPLVEFNPFKTKKPLTGWYEADYEYHDQWESLTKQALELIKN